MNCILIFLCFIGCNIVYFHTICFFINISLIKFCTFWEFTSFSRFRLAESNHCQKVTTVPLNFFCKHNIVRYDLFPFFLAWVQHEKAIFDETVLTSLCYKSAYQHNLQTYRIQFIECSKATSNSTLHSSQNKWFLIRDKRTIVR